MRSLCETCSHLRVIESPSGARFLMCRKSKEDARFPKYPPQPLFACAGHRGACEPSGEGANEDPDQ